jgi:hypothetical protein
MNKHIRKNGNYTRPDSEWNLIRQHTIKESIINEMCEHTTILFSIVCNQNPDRCWKSRISDHQFMVGLDTVCGSAVYQLDIECWDLFNVKEIETPKVFHFTLKEVTDILSVFSILEGHGHGQQD